MLGGVETDCRLTIKQFICERSALAQHSQADATTTFEGISFGHFPSQLLLPKLLLFIFSSLDLLYSLIVIVNSHAQYFLRPLLPDYEIIQMVLQNSWCYPRSA